MLSLFTCELWMPADSRRWKQGDGLIQWQLLRKHGRKVTQMACTDPTSEAWSQMPGCVSPGGIFREIKIRKKKKKEMSILSSRSYSSASLVCIVTGCAALLLPVFCSAWFTVLEGSLQWSLPEFHGNFHCVGFSVLCFRQFISKCRCVYSNSAPKGWALKTAALDAVWLTLCACFSTYLY